MLHHKLYSFRKTGLMKNVIFYCSSDCTYAEAEQQLEALTCKTKHNQNYLKNLRTQEIRTNTEHHTLCPPTAGSAERKAMRPDMTVTYLLTYSIQQSPSWEANRFSASQEFPRILWNPKVHYRFHKCRSPLPILSVPFRCLGRTKISVRVRGFICEYFVTRYFYMLRSCQHLAQPPSWRTTPRRLSATAYSIYSRLPSISEAVPPSATWGRAMPCWQGPTYHMVV